MKQGIPKEKARTRRTGMGPFFRAKRIVVYNLCSENSGKEKTHKHKQICGIVPGLGGCQNFVYVFFFGSFLMGEKNT